MDGGGFARVESVGVSAGGDESRGRGSGWRLVEWSGLLHAMGCVKRLKETTMASCLPAFIDPAAHKYNQYLLLMSSTE